MSLADRQKAAQKDLSTKAAQATAAREKDASVWSGLDMMGQSPSAAQSSTHNPGALNDDDWIFDKVQSQSQPKAKSPAKPAPPVSNGLDDDWGLGDFAAPASSSKSPSSSNQKGPSNDLFDSFDDGNTIPDSFGAAKQQTSELESVEGDDDDVLGLLGKPVEAVPKAPAEPQRVRESFLIF